MPVDILQDHRQRNRAARPPSPSRLSMMVPTPVSSNPSDSGNASVNNSATSTSTSNKRKARNSVRVPTETNAKVQQLRYYQDTHWVGVLERAKAHYRVFLAVKDAFRNPGDGLESANECIREAMVEHKIEVEPGTFTNCSPLYCHGADVLFRL
jgi:hypothetical protein